MSSSLISCVRENSPPLKFDLSSKERSKITNSNTLPPPSSKQTASSKSSTMADEPQDAANAQQHKKRRFHPLRNLRRIFRRRTITSASDTETSLFSPSASSSEKNLRSTTLSSISKAVSASSPSSPLTHQQLNDAYLTKSLPKSKSYGIALTGKSIKDEEPQLDSELESEQQDCVKKTNKKIGSKGREKHSDMYTTSALQNAPPLRHQRQSIGVAVLPTSRNINLFTEKHKLNSLGDSSEDLDSTGNKSVSNRQSESSNMAGTSRTANDSVNGGDMSDSQRSLSEGRLLDSDYGREGLSQSHDSVFSESTATASSISIVLKAELADVLRKRRNRPDTSEEDLGLPSSPTSPNKTNEKYHNQKLTTNTTKYTTNDLSLNLTKVQNGGSGSGSSSGAGGSNQKPAKTSTPNNSFVEETVETRTTTKRYARATTISTDVIWRQSPDHEDVVDDAREERLQLSHAAAKHKMAIRPTKRKMPSRLHRRTLDIATSIPESSEDTEKVVSGAKNTETIAKSSTLPSNVTVKSLAEEGNKTETPNDKKTTATKPTVLPLPSKKLPPMEMKLKSPIKAKNFSFASTKTTSTTTSTVTKPSRNASSNLTSSSPPSPLSPATATSPVASYRKEPGEHLTESIALTKTKDEIRVDNVDVNLKGVRSSKRTKADEVELDLHLNEPKKLLLSASDIDVEINDSMSSETGARNSVHSKASKKEELHEELKQSGLSGLLNSLAFNSKLEKSQSQSSSSSLMKENVIKYRSGPAARQRYVPKELDCEGNNAASKTSDEPALNKSNSSYETFESTSLIREFTKFKAQTSSSSLSSLKSEKHYDKKAKIIGLSPFQQKITRSSEAFDSARSQSNSSSSMETSTDYPLDYYEEKQRKAVEKSCSFRTLLPEEERAQHVRRNMPSLPDLSLSIRVIQPYPNEDSYCKGSRLVPSMPDEAEEKCVSLGFEINDNNLLKTRKEKPMSSSLESDKNLILTSFLAPAVVIPKISEPSADKEISEIEDNIDMIVKSPLISVLRSPSNPNLEKDKMERSADRTKPERPKTLHIEKTLDFMHPSNVANAVPLRDKFKAKETVVQPGENQKPSRRCISMVASNDGDISVPEFMKIQLNRVDPERIIRPNVVLTTNPNTIETSAPFKEQKTNVSTKKMEDSSPHSKPLVNVFNKTVKNVKETTHLSQTVHNLNSSNVSPSKNSKTAEDISSKNINSLEASMKPVFKNPENDLMVSKLQKESNLTKNFIANESQNLTQIFVATNAKLSSKNFQNVEAAKHLASKNGVTSPEKPETKQTNQKLMSNGLRAVDNSHSKSPKVVDSNKRGSVVSCEGLSINEVSSKGVKISEKILVNKNEVKNQVREVAESPCSPLGPAKPLTVSSPVKMKANIVIEKKLLTEEKEPLKTPPASPDKLQNSSSSEEISVTAKLSLQERKRLFMASDVKALNNNPEIVRQDRKKSLNDEQILRKTVKGSSESSTTPTSTQSKTPISSPSSPTNIGESVSQESVVFRKKSLLTNSLVNGNARLNADKNDNDPTPELMKVFARRSLKIKDEDIQALQSKVSEVTATITNISPKKISLGQTQKIIPPNIDSDKENQSASEEKLDKIPFEANSLPINNSLQNSSLNRNSVADFRQALNKFGSKNSSNQNSSNAKLPNSFSSTRIVSGNPNTAPATMISPEKRTDANTLKNSSNLEQNNNYQKLSITTNKAKPSLKPDEMKNQKLENHQTTSESFSKNIERSATISEFKAIHQRRAEWEQRAKESFK